jgi:outer membrane receptor for ferrienterochelin and colicins
MYGDGAGGAKDHSVNALLDWKINDEQSLSLEAVHGVERSWSSKKTFGDYGETIGEGFGAGRLIRDSYVLSHTGDWSFGSTKLDAYLNKFKNDIERGKANAEEKIVEGSLNLPFEWLVNQSLTLGGQWKREERMRPGITPCVIRPAATYAAATDRFDSRAASAAA